MWVNKLFKSLVQKITTNGDQATQLNEVTDSYPEESHDIHIQVYLACKCMHLFLWVYVFYVHVYIHIYTFTPFLEKVGF